MARRFLGGVVLLLVLSFPVRAAPPLPAVIAVPTQPAWKDLNSEQKRVLAPLLSDWDQMENFRRKKWLGIAERYPKMKPEAQRRVDERMRQWVGMTPEQRAKVRSDYKAFSQLPPEKKAAIQKKWLDYSSLSEEEKVRLKRGEFPVKAAVPVVKTDASVVSPFSSDEVVLPEGKPTVVPGGGQDLQQDR